MKNLWITAILVLHSIACSKITHLSSDAVFSTGLDDGSTVIKSTAFPDDSFLAEDGFIEYYDDEDSSGQTVIMKRETALVFANGEPRSEVKKTQLDWSWRRYERFHDEVWLPPLEKKFEEARLNCTPSGLSVPGFVFPEGFWIDRLVTVDDLNGDGRSDLIVISVREKDKWIFVSIFLSDQERFRLVNSGKIAGRCGETAIPVIEVLPYRDAPDQKYLRMEKLGRRWTDGVFTSSIDLIMFRPTGIRP